MEKNKQIKEENLYSYFMHFNSYTGYWNAFLRDDAVYYLNGTLDDNNVLKNKDISVLISYINKNG